MTPAASDRRLDYFPGSGLLVIKEAGTSDGYYVRQLSAPYAPVVVVRMTKCAKDRKAGEASDYVVESGPGGYGRCDECRGFRYRRQCRHVAALGRLVSKGHFADEF